MRGLYNRPTNIMGHRQTNSLRPQSAAHEGGWTSWERAAHQAGPHNRDPLYVVGSSLLHVAGGCKWSKFYINTLIKLDYTISALEIPSKYGRTLAPCRQEDLPYSCMASAGLSVAAAFPCPFLRFPERQTGVGRERERESDQAFDDHKKNIIKEKGIESESWGEKSRENQRTS